MKNEMTDITPYDVKADFEFEVIDPTDVALEYKAVHQPWVTVGYEENYTSILREAFDMSSVYGSSMTVTRYGKKDMSGLKNLLGVVK